MGVRLRWALCAAGGLALVVPGAAQAAKKTVSMGVPAASVGTLQKSGGDINAFFPSTVTIHAGDSVAFAPSGFHSVEFPGAGKRPTPFAGPTGKKVGGLLDESGAPFWFAGLDEVGLSPALLKSNFGKTKVKGTSSLTSGLPLGPRLKPFTVRFPKVGVFTYVCNIHPGQKGTVRVVAKGKRVPSAKADALRVKQQLAAGLKVLKALPKTTKPPANTVALGADGKGGVHFFGFLPGKLTVAAGTTVTFRMPTVSTETHTATFGPAGTDEKSFPTSYVGKIAASFESPAFDARGTYQSDAPGPPAALSPTLHGNGYWNTGLLDGVSASPLPVSSSVTFSTPGTYGYVCLIHPFMRGSVTVQ